MDRRQFVAASGAAAAFSLLPSVAFAQGASGDTALNSLFEAIFADNLRHSPELASSLGLDKGPNVAWKSMLSPSTAAERRASLARTKKALASLKAVDPKTLSAAAKLNRDVVIYQIESRMVAADKFDIDGVQRPYRIFQQGGNYFELPDFLNTAHTINTAADCEAYLARLALVATALDEDTAEQRAEAARGYLAPGWSIDLTVGQMAKLRAPAPEANTMVDSLVKRPRVLRATGAHAPARSLPTKSIRRSTARSR
jgi:uncharacterized protein (DUF885 family)